MQRVKVRTRFSSLGYRSHWSHILFFAVLLASAPPSWASLQLYQPDTATAVTYVGRGGVSADGLGQLSPGGSLRAEVPAGSNVELALLYAATVFGGDTTALSFAGNEVTLSPLPDVGASWFSTSRADVTSIVRAAIGTGGGIYSFTVNSDPTTPLLNGVALVVVYSNKSLPTRSIFVLDGGTGFDTETTTIAFGRAVSKKRGFQATLSLGIQHSYQGAGVSGQPGDHVCGTSVGQFSIVDVNGRRVTSCAGNYDNGFAADGALVTVGGVTDNLDTPVDPYQQAGDGALPRITDDELYDITSYVNDGDTSLRLTTSNPSKDDSIFLAILQVSGEAAAATRPTLTFPIQGVTAYDALISSVLDHSGKRPFQESDGKVLAYTGEWGLKGAGVCDENLYSNNLGTDFVVNGNYESTTQCGTKFLSYNGHAGYDYKYGVDTVLIAPADGTVWIPAQDPINGNGKGNPAPKSPWCGFHTFYIDHGNGYQTWFLHSSGFYETITNPLPTDYCDSRPKTDVRVADVMRGDPVAYSGNFYKVLGGIPAHVHFEVRSNGKTLDPYGWEGGGVDPIALGNAENMWGAAVPIVETISATEDVVGDITIAVSGLNFDPGASIEIWYKSDSNGTNADGHFVETASLVSRTTHSLVGTWHFPFPMAGNYVVKVKNAAGPRSVPLQLELAP